MAVGYHFGAKPISRGAGQSAVHTAAYNSRSQLTNEREDKLTKDYSDRGGLMFEGIFAPKGAPDWAHDREQLWNHAEAAENRKDAQTARNLSVALPAELTDEQREWLVKDFARSLSRQGMVADVAIHAPDEKGDERNYHAHILVTTRRLDGDDFAATKAREWNSRETLNEWRGEFAEMAGRALDRAGFKEEGDRWRHGHETLGRQKEAAEGRGDFEYAEGCSREATRHKGPTVTAMERRGVEIERPDVAEAKETRQLKDEIKGLEAELKAAEAEQAKPGRAQARAERQAEHEARADKYAKATEALGEVSGEIAGDQSGVRVAGGASKIADAALDTVAGVAELILGFLDPAPRRYITPEELAASKSARDELKAQRAAEREERQAIDRIAKQIEADKPVERTDLEKLGREKLEDLKERGDDALRDMVRQREEELSRQRDDSGRRLGR